MVGMSTVPVIVVGLWQPIITFTALSAKLVVVSTVPLKLNSTISCAAVMAVLIFTIPLETVSLVARAPEIGLPAE